MGIFMFCVFDLVYRVSPVASGQGGHEKWSTMQS